MPVELVCELRHLGRDALKLDQPRVGGASALSFLLALLEEAGQQVLVPSGHAY